MPVYEYECPRCQAIHEVLQSIRDEPLDACPKCQGAVVRVLSAPNLNTRNLSGRADARYARMSSSEEVARERVLQANYETLPFPPGVKHNPWERQA